jgi:serine/threonine protein kinase
MIGTKLLHYEITEKLGEGGMGVVYKARDTHLDRFVAIKVLPPERVSDPSRKARFVQEAKSASSLNHPNIVTIHDISSDSGVDFIAMEYVNGRTLDQLIPSKGMRLNEALKLAIQIADALTRAHAVGIIHRDLKPANIMVDGHGHVKVLDFGLAKLTEVTTDDRTVTMKTEEGAIVGTAAYMSPEQAEGRQIDARSDIFSFGAVLYEMASGRRPFQGDSKMSTLAAVLHHDPPDLGIEIPAEFRKLISRCLRKDAARRFQHMGDIRMEMEEMREESEPGRLATTATKSSRRGPVRIWAALAGAIVIATVSWFAWQRLKQPVPGPRLLALTSYPGVEQFPAVSPDGRQVAFSWNGEQQDNEDIYVQLIGSSAPPLRLTQDPAPERVAVWSPDGAQLAFVRLRGGQSTIHIISALGGQERKVLEFVPVLGTFDKMAPAITWSPDGKWLAVPMLGPDQTNAVSLVPVEHGEARKIISNTVAEGRFHWPAVSPKGDYLAYATRAGERASDLYVLELDSGYVPKGNPRRLTRRGAIILGIAWAPDAKSLVYAATPDLGATPHLWRLAVTGQAEPERLEIAGEGALHPTIAPGGKRLVYSKIEGSSDIWKFEAGSPPHRFISSTRNDYGVEFSPDGGRVAFATDRSGTGSELWIAKKEGSNLVRLATGMGGMMGAPRWSPDGRWIAFNAQGEDGRWDIYRIDSTGGQPRRLTPESSDEVLPSWSRDGKWIYYNSNRTGRTEVYRIPSGGGESAQITKDGGSEPRESPDGRTLYYRRAGVRLIAFDLASGAERQILDPVRMMSYATFEDGIYHVLPTAGRNADGFEIRFLRLGTGADELVHRSSLRFNEALTVSPDRKTILLSASPSPNADLIVVENFR